MVMVVVLIQVYLRANKIYVILYRALMGTWILRGNSVYIFVFF